MPFGNTLLVRYRKIRKFFFFLMAGQENGTKEILSNSQFRAFLLGSDNFYCVILDNLYSIIFLKDNLKENVNFCFP